MSPDDPDIGFERHLRHWPEFRYLTPWLEIATDGLSRESKARIHEEIRAHFHDALADGIRAGLLDDVAARRAIESLGSPQKARRDFRRAYLTEFQEANVRPFRDPPLSSTVGVIIVLALCAWALKIQPGGYSTVWFIRLAAFSSAALAFAIQVLLVPRIFRRGHERTAVIVGVAMSTVMWSGFLIGLIGSPTGALRTWPLPAFAVLMVIAFYPIVRKLGNPPSRPA